jgi:hypothetical protein
LLWNKSTQPTYKLKPTSASNHSTSKPGSLQLLRNISETSPNRKAQGPKIPKASRHRGGISREDLHGKGKKKEKKDSS